MSLSSVSIGASDEGRITLASLAELGFDGSCRPSPPSLQNRNSSTQARHSRMAPTTLPMTMPAMAPWLRPDEEEEVEEAGTADEEDDELLKEGVTTTALLAMLLGLKLLELLELLLATLG